MTAPNPSTAMARVVIDELTRHGLTRFVAAPGSRSAAPVIASVSHPDIELRMSLDERSAGFFALGLGRGSGVPGVVICTSGSAVANLAPAVVEADTAGVPLLLLTCDRPPELHHTGANQTMDQADFFKGRTRFSVNLGPAENTEDAVRLWRTTVDRAVLEAMGSPPGPVQINLMFREPTSPVTDDGRSIAEPFRYPLGDSGRRPLVATSTGTVVPELPDDLIAEVKRRRGLVVCGEASSKAARHLGERLGWPVLVEARAGGRSDDVITAYQHLVHRSELAPEMLIRLGAVGVSSGMLRLLGSGIPQVMVDQRWVDPLRSATWAIRSDPTAFVGVLAETVGDPRDDGWRDSWLAADKQARATVDDCVDSHDFLTSARVARDIAVATPKTLVVGSSLPIRDVDDFAWVTPRRVISNRGLSGIDGFVSTALGVATVEPTTVALCGDLTLLHDSNGFLVENRPPLTVVVIDNDGGRIFERLPHAKHAPDFERIFTTPHGRDLAKLADFHRLEYVAVDTPGDLTGSVEEGGDVRLVHVRVDPTRDREARAEIDRAVGKL